MVTCENQLNENEQKFYIYEHWRPDKNICFYVGKGHGNRAFRLRKNRNKFHRHIVDKLEKNGLCIDVRIISDELSEPEALKLEVERISFWRNQGVVLTNLTDGGEGVSGLKHSEKTKDLLRELSKSSLQKRWSAPKAREIKSALAKKYFSNSENIEKHRALAIKVMSDPDVRERISRAMVEISADPAVRTARSNAMKKFFADPQNRQSLRDRSFEIGSRPEIRAARQRSARESWNNAKVIERRIKGIKEALAKPEEKARRAEIMRKRMADPVYREKMSRINKARHQANRDSQPKFIGKS